MDEPIRTRNLRHADRRLIQVISLGHVTSYGAYDSSMPKIWAPVRSGAAVKTVDAAGSRRRGRIYQRAQQEAP